MEDLKTWLVKFLLPSIVAISIKLAIKAKKSPVTWFNLITSFVTGIGAAYLFFPVITSSFSPEYTPLAVAAISMSGEKIGIWAIYKFNIESLLESFVERLKKK